MEASVSGALVGLHSIVQVRVPSHKEVRSISSLGKFFRQKCPSPNFDTYEKLDHEKAILEWCKLRCIAT